jgi:hypothetical protein
MNTNPFKADFNIKSGTIEIRDNQVDGTLRFSCMIDEARPIIDQMLAAIRKAEFVFLNPLLDTRCIDSAMKESEERKASLQSFDTMVEWYLFALALFRDAGEVIEAFMYVSDGVDHREFDELQAVLNKINLVVEANKHHLPESGTGPK